MKQFNLPDLGEGLAEALIVKWLVSEGQVVDEDQPLVTVETDKAVLDIPSPYKGTIAKLHAKEEETLAVGAPLVSFDLVGEPAPALRSLPIAEDSGTVVGEIQVSDEVIQEAATGITPQAQAEGRIKAAPAVRALAASLGVDLAQVRPSGPGGSVSLADVQQAAGSSPTPRPQAAPSPASAPEPAASPGPGRQKLSGPRRVMAQKMAQSRDQVVAVTLFDEVILAGFDPSWDLTCLIIQALVEACAAVPQLNAHFHAEDLSLECFDQVNLGLAVDSPLGLFVPVIKGADRLNAKGLRQAINQYKDKGQKGSYSPEDLSGASISLSNFGTLAGRFATPVVVVPQVAILGVGRIRDELVAWGKKAVVEPVLPLSLTFDHRAATGGEASRFLAQVIQSLQRHGS